MTNYSWFANSANLTLTIGGTPIPVAALRNVSFTPHFETAELYGMESLLRQGVAKYQHSVDVKCEFAMWDTENDYVLNSVLAGGYSTTATTLDTGCARAKCALFNITATVYDTTCAKKLTATIYDVYFNDVPFELRENEFISRSLAGKGKLMQLTYANA